MQRVKKKIMKTQIKKSSGSGLGAKQNKVKSEAELLSMKKLLNWQIGFAIEGILRYRRLGLREMEAWSRGRLACAKTILGNMEFDRHEAFKAYVSASSFVVDQV
jgi:hypothetical protein